MAVLMNEATTIKIQEANIAVQLGQLEKICQKLYLKLHNSDMLSSFRFLIETPISSSSQLP